MVSISRRRVKQQQQQQQRGHGLLLMNGFLPRRVRAGQYYSKNQCLAVVTCLGLVVGLVVFWAWLQLFHAATSQPVSFSNSSMRSPPNRQQRLESTLQHPQLHVVSDTSLDQERFNVLALDILRTLDCVTLFNQTNTSDNGDTGLDAKEERRRRRRLEEDVDEDPDAEINNKSGGEDEDEERNENKSGGEDKAEELNENMDDQLGADGDGSFDKREYQEATARHLLCLAAYTPLMDDMQVDPDPGALYWKKRIKCDATDRRQRALLESWSAARSAFPNKQFLLQVLDMTTQQQRNLVEHDLHLWLPQLDDGTDHSLGTINNQQLDADHGGIHGLSHRLGNGKTFVDVGSAFGITGLAVSLLYPGTRIVSIEAAPPNWLMQEFNWICLHDNEAVGNDQKLAPVAQRVLAGVGPVSGGLQFAPMMWRKDAPSATRSWTKASEINTSQDVKIDVQLKSWHSILMETGLRAHELEVLNVDCEGCEYNLIPDLSDQEFESIPTVIGDVHWGYIPTGKKPSSKRAEITHKRLCSHENMARTAKECCAFLDLPVKSSVPGQVDVDMTNRTYAEKTTVSDIAGDFCDGFDEWAVERSLFSIQSDWGWFQLTSTADD